MADSVMKWYVVRAIGGQENKVKSYIETEIDRMGLSDYVSQVLVPKEKVIQIRNGKKINKEKVYFPGYIMIEANLTGEVPHVIKAITGVIGFLGETKGGDPVPMRNIVSHPTMFVHKLNRWKEDGRTRQQNLHLCPILKNPHVCRS